MAAVVSPRPVGAEAARGLAAVAEEATRCERCPLYRDATQLVFGEGPVGADLMLVGEQPGDREDLAGRPFVGPAGRVLDEALREVGIERGAVYVTNAVKHFKHELRGKRRLHKTPNRGEVEACRWWLDRELEWVAPKLVVALGATAASALMRRPVVLKRERGRALRWADGRDGLATVHPAAILRIREVAAQQEALQAFEADLREARRLVRSGAGG